jgi:hypothetical protein
MLHAQNQHAMQPHCCYRSPVAIGETGHLELKLVPFVAPTDARSCRPPSCVGGNIAMRGSKTVALSTRSVILSNPLGTGARYERVPCFMLDTKRRNMVLKLAILHRFLLACKRATGIPFLPGLCKRLSPAVQ